MQDPDADWEHKLQVTETIMGEHDFFDEADLLAVHEEGFSVLMQGSVVHVFCNWIAGSFAFDGSLNSGSVESFVESQLSVAGVYLVEGELDCAMSMLSSCRGVLDELVSRRSVDEFLNVKKVRVLESSQSIDWRGGSDSPDFDRFCRSFLSGGLEKAQNELIQDSMGLMIRGIDHFVDLSGSYLLSQRHQGDDKKAALLRALVDHAAIIQNEIEDVLDLDVTEDLVDFLNLAESEIRKSLDFFYLLRQ